jgi:hypothetical protein
MTSSALLARLTALMLLFDAKIGPSAKYGITSMYLGGSRTGGLSLQIQLDPDPIVLQLEYTTYQKHRK